MKPWAACDGTWRLVGEFGAAELGQILVVSAVTEEGQSYVYSTPVRADSGEEAAIRATMLRGCEADLRWEGTPPDSFAVRVALDPSRSLWLNLPGQSLEGATATAIGLPPNALCPVVPGNLAFPTGQSGARTAVVIP